VVFNKIRRSIGLKIDFDKYIDYSDINEDYSINKRTYYLEKPVKKVTQPSESSHYKQFGNFFNR